MTASWSERHIVNRAVRLGARLGRDIDGVRELEVAGRRTGRRRRTPVKVLEVEGELYVVSLSGSCGRVCNLRAGRTARLRLGRRVDDVLATELADEQKAPVVRAYLASATRPATRARLGSASVPVFHLTPRDAGGSIRRP
jgi:deazaflavin-dependent oxidoreductase (nitroreductase family)